MHPTLRIIGLIELAIMVQYLSWQPLACLTALMLMIVLGFWRSIFLRTLRRSRWLLLSLVLIFAFTTPGEDLPGWPLFFAPTYEGLSGGATQVLRLLVMLGGLSALLGSTGREMLMSGIFQLLSPLGRMGLPVERLAARLWLTLHYMETNPQPIGRSHFMQRLGSNDTMDMAVADFQLLNSSWGKMDSLILVMMVTALIWVSR